MFRALFWKEWRQLALVRWGGIAIGVLLPLAFLAGAEMAKRGVLPTGSIDRYQPADVLYEIVPTAMAIALWPLIALMSAAQAIAGDRSAGTESFLLERPITRSSVWRARIASAAVNLVFVIVVTAGLGSLIAKVSAAPSQGWERWTQSILAGPAVAALAMLGGLIAASLIASPMAAVLGGAVLGALPALLAAQLIAGFPHATIGPVPLGLVLPVLLLPAYVVASWTASCRGEPAGRGRVKRGLLTTGSTLALIGGLFVVVAPVSVRARAARGWHAIELDRQGRSAFVGSSSEYGGGGGWLVDLASSRKTGFVPPPFRDVAFQPEGDLVAILTWSAPLGGETKRDRIELRQASTGRLERSIGTPGDEPVMAVGWVDRAVVVLITRNTTPNGHTYEVLAANPLSNDSWRSLGLVQSEWAAFTAPRHDGRLFLRTSGDLIDAGGVRRIRGYHLRPIEAGLRRIGEPISDASGKPIEFASWLAGLSPSGKLGTTATTVDLHSDRSGIAVTDLATGSVRVVDSSVNDEQWLSGDRLVWLENEGAGGSRVRLRSMGSDGKIVTLRAWRNAAVRIQVSPLGEAVYLSAHELAPGHGKALDPGDPEGTVPEHGILRVAEGKWFSINPACSEAEECTTTWASERTLARIGPGFLAFEDIDHPGVKRFVLGSEADLR
ncbi:MAG TPA: ABC transporter permease subunit [Candidatus Polarisedimenticolaceae bacterium]|nr:ABC transporter permease subunit [Candidatus Polarisedimenticolaceae bacterium]